MTASVDTQDPLTERGEERAFRAFYEAHKNELFAFLLRLVRDPAEAEDLTQETFLRAYRALDQRAPGRSLRPWVFQIARNAAVDHLRCQEKAGRNLQGKARRDDPETPDPAQALGHQEAAATTQRALDTLPAEDRALLLQRHGCNMKLQELAESLGCTERTVRNRLKRAADRLTRAVLEKRRGS